MWPSPNMHTLPSKDEIQMAKEEIECIELEITETQLRLDALKNSLTERKAWIAPIRTIPHELLSLIFVEVSRMEWWAPLGLQAVCRQWHEVIVESPGAWAFIPLSVYKSSEKFDLVSTFLQRSRNTPLHILLNGNSREYMERLQERIECICWITPWIFVNHYLQGGRHFHRLERLKITITGGLPPGAGLAPWDMSCFPNLKVLDIYSASHSLPKDILDAHEVPAIRHLTVRCEDPARIVGILAKCANFLESVQLSYNTLQTERSDRECAFHLPRLRYLRLADWSILKGSRFHFKATAPNLEVYIDDGDALISNAVKIDTSNVTILKVSHTPDLSHFPRIVNLCFSRERKEIEETVEWLRDNPTLCPELTLIGHTASLVPERLGKVKEALLARGDLTGRTIRLVKETVMEQDERIRLLRGLELCPKYMPCNHC